MNKQKFKEFMSRNKTTFIIVGSAIVGTALGAAGIRMVTKSRLNGGDLTWVKNMCNDIDTCRDGCNHYTLVTEAAEIEGLLTKKVVRDPAGKLLDIKSLMLFGNEITADQG